MSYPGLSLEGQVALVTGSARGIGAALAIGLAQGIRPAVIIRKNSYGNRSDQGADTQAIFMSIFFTLKKRGHHPVDTIYDALTTYLKTSQLPPLPKNAPADG